MKQIFTILVALLATTNLWAYDFHYGELCYNITSDTTVEVTFIDFSYNYDGLITTIPETVTYKGTTYSVTSIGEYAFVNCSALTSVTIGNSVTSIGVGAFNGCSSLTSVTIGNSVTSIGSQAFYYCVSLTSVTIPNSVTSIEYEAFAYCYDLTSVTIGNSVTSIGEVAFRDCSNLTSVTIGNSVTSIGNYAFEGCSSLPVENNLRYADTYLVEAVDKTLSTYSIKEGTKWIGDGAFAWCPSLTSVTIPNSVTSIGERAFNSCRSFTSITIPNSVTSIGNRAFGDCSTLTSVTIPNSVTSIGEGAFGDCSALTSVTIGNSVTSIGEGAFEGTNLTSFICYNPSLTYFGLGTQPLLDTIVAPAAFFDVEEADWASAPKHVRYARVIAGELTENAFGVINRSYKTLKVLDLEAATNTSIADEAFKGCYNLDSLYLPSNLTYIPYMAVAECVSLQYITIPATVEEVEKRAFENCRSLQSIIFEDSAPAQGPAHYAAASGSSLWRIGSWAFYNCHQLQELTIPEGVTEIGDAAFYGCTYLEDMVLPSTIQAIGDNGFALCAKLQKIHVKATTPPTIQAKTFFDVNRQIPVYVPDGAVEAYEDDPYWQEFDIQCNSSTPTAVEDVTAYGSGIQKLIRDGQVIIVRDGKSYSVMGQEL